MVELALERYLQAGGLSDVGIEHGVRTRGASVSGSRVNVVHLESVPPGIVTASSVLVVIIRSCPG
nr:hypothetical protein [Kibdelosporangium sp. MJ126-NF4]